LSQTESEITLNKLDTIEPQDHKRILEKDIPSTEEAELVECKYFYYLVIDQESKEEEEETLETLKTNKTKKNILKKDKKTPSLKK